MSDYQPDYNVYFERGDIARALECLYEYGYCVIRKMIDADWVEQLKNEIDAVLDPECNLAPASNRYHMMLAEESKALWRLVEHEPYRNYIRAVHGTDEVCLHRSAAILRTPGEGMARGIRTTGDISRNRRLPTRCSTAFRCRVARGFTSMARTQSAAVSP